MNLPAPRTRAGRDGMASVLRDSAHALIAMDFDGTLAPIVADPQDARVHPRTADVLRRLTPHVGRLAIITGRPANVAVDYGDLAHVPRLVVLGHYGLERWENGSVSEPDPAPGIEIARRRLPALLEELRAPEGTVVEDKGHAIAVHVRRTRNPQDALELVARPVSALAREAGLTVEPGRMVLELRPPGADKGRALGRLAEPMRRDDELSAVVFIGDDLADLAAFDEIERLRAAGVPGLAVCSASAEVPALADRADLVVDGPDGVLRWLDALADHVCTS